MSISALLARKGSQVTTIRSTDSVGKAVHLLHDERIGALVVVDRRGNLVGMFSERDVIHALAEDATKALDYEVHEFMSTDVTTCAPDDRIDKVMAIMTVHRIRHLPVMEEGRLVGLVSIGDLVKHRLDEKEIETNVLLDIARAHS
jgi:CBS domain-containing protein